MEGLLLAGNETMALSKAVNFNFYLDHNYTLGLVGWLLDLWMLNGSLPLFFRFLLFSVPKTDLFFSGSLVNFKCQNRVCVCRTCVQLNDLLLSRQWLDSTNKNKNLKTQSHTPTYTEREREETTPFQNINCLICFCLNYNSHNKHKIVLSTYRPWQEMGGPETITSQHPCYM